MLVHNHPSGDAQPSRDDIEMTQAIADACRPLGIVIHDHIIIAGDAVASFKSLGLLYLRIKSLFRTVINLLVMKQPT